MPSIIDLLQEQFGEELKPGREGAFEMTSERAGRLFHRYTQITDVDEFSVVNNTLSRNSLLLARPVSPIMTGAVGGDHLVTDQEREAYRTAKFGPRPDISTFPRKPGESELSHLLHVALRNPEPSYTEDDVRDFRPHQLKSLLLTVPSVTVTDQVWFISSYLSGLDEKNGFGPIFRERWRSYIRWLITIRPLIEQGAVRIVSAKRMHDITHYEQNDGTLDQQLLNQLHGLYFGKDEEVYVRNAVKYSLSLSEHYTQPFYETRENITLHEAIFKLRLRLVKALSEANYAPAFRGFFAPGIAGI